MHTCEPTDLLTQVTRSSDHLIKSIFKNANQIEELDNKISIRSMIREIDQHKFKLPLHIYNHFTVFHSNCLWESLKRKAAEPANVEIYLFSTPEDLCTLFGNIKIDISTLGRAFGGPRAEVFLKGYIEPYPNEKHIDSFVRVDTYLN